MDHDELDTLSEDQESGISSMEEHRHEHHQRMVEADTACPDVLVQIAAVRAALNSVGRVILEDHLESCMVDAVEKDNYEQSLKDLKISLDKFIG
jgi:DNA-binding FrmR family transcriptional regulator